MENGNDELVIRIFKKIFAIQEFMDEMSKKGDFQKAMDCTELMQLYLDVLDRFIPDAEILEEA